MTQAYEVKGLKRPATIILIAVCLTGIAAVILMATRGRIMPEVVEESADGLRYEQYRDPSELWTVHVVRAPRGNGRFEIGSRHAAGRAIGLTPVTAQLALTNAAGTPVAAINGDYYQRQGPYAGDPRGLQIVDGELISAPDGGPSIWLDEEGEPRAGRVKSRLQVDWPDGSFTSLRWNESRPPDRVALYTPAIGPSTRTRDGREFVLDLPGLARGETLQAGHTYRARVRAMQESGDTPIPSDAVVLSVGPEAVARLPELASGSELVLSTHTEPSLRGARTAISGGPLLVRNGRRLRIEVPDSQSYEFSSMMERHPRAAVGWNDADFLLVAVDGRKIGTAEGMTLKELAGYLVRLGCREAMNLDGGGSSTLWFDGSVRNFLCDGYERDVANCLFVARKPGTTAGPAETGQPPAPSP